MFGEFGLDEADESEDGQERPGDRAYEQCADECPRKWAGELEMVSGVCDGRQRGLMDEVVDGMKVEGLLYFGEGRQEQLKEG